ncbi:MAG: EamA family transporter [Synechococcales bacterium]|nr:EamA family transporter [Synechococcales bacterium]
MVATLASVAGQFFLKSGANQLGAVSLGNLGRFLLTMTTTPAIVVGLACYAIGAIAYIFALSRIPLSIVGPSVALSYVFSVLMGKFFFGEMIPTVRYVGVSLIMVGVILLVRK